MSPTDAAPHSVLRHRPFVFYWSARTCVAMGFQMLGVAVAWQMYALTGSAFDLGFVGLVQFLPRAAFMLVAGQVADRYDRRRLLQICQTVEGFAAATLALGSVAGSVTREFLLTTVFIFGVGRAFDSPTQQTVLPAIVPVSLFPRAVAASASTTQFATIIGPALGGIALRLRRGGSLHDLRRAIPRVGGPAGSSCASSVSSAIRSPSASQHSSPASRISGTIRSCSASSRSICSPSCSAAPPRCCQSSPMKSSTPARRALACCARHRRSARLAITAILTTSPLTRRVGRIMFACVACFGLATIVFALSKSFILSMAALAVLGASDAVSVVIRMTLVQLETPDEMRGRVNAVSSLFSGTSNQLGDFRAGVMAAWLGTVPAVLVGGIGTMLVVLIWTRAFPPLSRVDSFYAKKP